jgi:hypothetical protein
MATKLGTYNKSLIALGDGVPLASLSENRAARRFLDQVWDNGVVNYCLEQGLWGFATRSKELTASTTINPAFGFQYAFEMPDDFCGLNSLWTDARFQSALRIYDFEAGIIYCDFGTIYIKYVSNAPTYGGNIAKWPEVFSDYVGVRMAFEAQPLITNSLNVDANLDKAQQSAKLTALNWDKRNKAREDLPIGNWTKARLGYDRIWGAWGGQS